MRKSFFVVMGCILLTLSTVSPTGQVSAERIPMLTITQNPISPDVLCLAQNMYHEARWESYEGKLAVATVTLNRVGSPEYPDTICGVVYQQNPRGCQFSWVCMETAPVDIERFAAIRELAERILQDSLRYREVKDALFYHADYVSPLWAEDMTRIHKVGAHIFYVTENQEKRRRGEG